MPQTGAIYTHDSQSYDYAATTLLKDGQMKYFGYDTPIIQWPPLYILITAVLKLFDVPLTQGAIWINAISFAYLIYACATYLFESLSVKWMAVPALILITVSIPMVYISGYAWTEMLFIFLSMLSMIFMLRYIKGQKQGWLIAASVVSSLCWLTRYIGIVTIAVLALILFLSVKPVLRRIRLTFVYLVFSCLPMSLWVIRNYLISGTFTGGRQAGLYTLKDNIWLSVMVFREWSSFLTPLFSYIGTVFFIMLVCITFFLEKKEKKPELPVDLITVSMYILFYAAALLASATSTAMDPINIRLWSPVFPFWILFLVFLMDVLIRNLKEERLKQWLAAAFVVFSLVCAISPALWIQSRGFARKHVFTGLKEDIGMKYSPVLALARDKIPGYRETLVISNDAALLAMHSGLKCYYPPKKYSIPLYSFSRYKESMDLFRFVYIVWSGPLESESFMTMSEFRRLYDLEKIAQNNYCWIYRVRPKRNPYRSP
jgi:hypothetical protein